MKNNPPTIIGIFILVMGLILGMTLFLKKPANIQDTKIVEKCNAYDKFCEASEACKNQGGKLKTYDGNDLSTSYKFECEYSP